MTKDTTGKAHAPNTPTLRGGRRHPVSRTAHLDDFAVVNLDRCHAAGRVAVRLRQREDTCLAARTPSRI